MINFKKNFTEGINCDDSIKSLSPGQYLNMENCRVSASGLTTDFEINNIPSTRLLYDPSLGYVNRTIGHAVDLSRLRLIWLNYNSRSADGIYAYDLQADTVYTVLLSSQTEEGLNFTLSNRVDRNVRVIGDLLTWTDDNNEPQCINIEAGIKLNHPAYVTDTDPYATPIPYTTLTLIKRPPVYALQVSRLTDSGFSGNYTQNNAYFFLYRYIYKNYNTSALSTHSQLIPYNAVDETYNAINIKLTFNELIDDYVQQVDICVKYGFYGKTFVIKSYNKDNYYDAIAIQDHNLSVTQLGFTFYDNVTGIALDDTEASTSQHLVALRAKTLEIARNRLFLGNVLKGYDTPNTTSLHATLGTFNTGSSGTYTAHWKYFYLTHQLQVYPYTTGTTQFYYAYYGSISPTSYYYDTYKYTATPPATLNAADATSSWATETQVAAYVQRNVSPPVGTRWVNTSYTFYDTGLTTSLIVVVDISNVQFFKSFSKYYISIAFYDRFRRKCGVVNRYVNVDTSARTYAQSVFDSTINWALSNAAATTEIPDWAYYYQIHISKNLATRTFVQIRTIGAAYVTKNDDGTYDKTGTTFDSDTTYATGIDITTLTSVGLGYTFSEGDFVRIIDNSNNIYTLAVIGQDGNYIFAKPTDVGTLSTTTTLFITELYTPYSPSITEPLFETGIVMPILNPTTNSRTYSTTSGSINGDCYAIERGQVGDNYFVEAMSPNDNKWSIWQTDTGWVNFIDTIGQQDKTTNIDYSDTYIAGTKTNGLNVFQPLNTKNIGSDSGEIQKLQLTNKQQEDGTVMLAIATSTPLSIYLGETQVVASAQNTFIASNTDVIGTINALRNGYGTINPESVVEYNGSVWWFDALHGLTCQYSQDGVVAVSDYKMKRFWDRYGKRYVEQGSDVIEAFCGFSYVTSCVDPSTDEVMFVLPQVEENVVVSGLPMGFAQPLPSYSTLPDYASSIQNRFDIYDGQAKIVSYKFLKNQWGNVYQWLPDCMEYLGNKLFGFKDGVLYLHNESLSSYNTIYGVQYPMRVCLPANQDPSLVKDLFDTAVEGNAYPNFVVAYTNYEYEQITDLADTDSAWSDQEGQLYATFYRDRLSPNIEGTPVQRLYQGDLIKTIVPLLMYEWRVYDNLVKITFINIGFSISRGQKKLVNQK